jgi:hypothetical protein
MPVSLASSICSPGFVCLFLLSAFASSTVCLDPLLPYQLLVRIGSQRSRGDSFALPVSPVSSIRLPGFLLPLPSAYFCFPHRVLRSGPLSDLLGRGTINSTKTLLGIAHALTVNSSGFESLRIGSAPRSRQACWPVSVPEDSCHHGPTCKGGAEQFRLEAR